jgi:hypothetical protein
MSRRAGDSSNAGHFSLVADWSNYSPFHRNRSGYRLIATKDWNLYAVSEIDNLMCVYDTEQWVEWIVRIDVNLHDLFLYSDRYHPSPLLADGAHLTLAAFLSGI